VDARKAKTGPQQETKTPVQHSVLAAPQTSAIDRKRDQMEQLVSLQDELFRESMGVLRDAMRFRDIDPSLERELDPAFEAMEVELGQAGAQRAHRVAVLASLPSADAPIGLKLAANVAVGIMKAKATEKGGTHVLNVAKVILSSDALPQFEEREVESE
jgi:hypothetical protein